jgi:purine-cytosine permease-like protein
VGNIVPALLALVTRVFWGGVLLWVLAEAAAIVLGSETLALAIAVVCVLVAALVAIVGFGLLARFQLVVSILSALLIAGFVALTVDRVDVAAALTVDDGPWILVVTGAVLVFSFVGLIWASSSSDLARYQRPGSIGGANMLWATFGTALPSFLLIAYGSLLAASDPELAASLVAQPVEAITGILPSWYAIPLVAATALSLLSGVVVTLYSGAFALQGAGVRVARHWATVIVTVLVAAIALFLVALDLDLTEVFRDLATTLAVPVAAWVGIFAADTMIRNRPFHTASLLRPGGVYPRVNWVALPALLAITAIGWGLTTATVAGLDWQGFILSAAGVPLEGELASSDLGVLVALGLGLLVPAVFGVRTIRRQEDAALLLPVERAPERAPERAGA